jgi:hypothetical protein
MPNRAARFASAVLASVLAGAFLTAIPRSAAATDDECLSAPKGETPQGSHWYYKFDRASKRQCWYLRDEGEVAAANVAPAKPSSKPASAAMQPAMADARAELPPPRNAAPSREDLPAVTITANAPLSEADKVLQPPPLAQPLSAVATSRWPGQPDAYTTTGPAANPGVSAAPVPDNAYANADAGPALQAQPPSPPVANQFTAPDLPPAPTHSVQMLLAAILGALALAGVMARLIFNFVGTRRRARRKPRGGRAAIWKSAAPARRKQAIYVGAAKPPQPHSPRDLDQVGDPDDRIAELLRDFSRKTRAANRRQSGVGSVL